MHVTVFGKMQLTDVLDNISDTFLDQSLPIGGKLFVDMSEMAFKPDAKQMETIVQYIIGFAKHMSFRMALLSNDFKISPELIMAEKIINEHNIDFKFFSLEQHAMEWLALPVKNLVKNPS